MPPKSYTKKSLSESSKPKVSNATEQQFNDELYINPKNVVENSKTLERIRILTSLMAGLLAGIFDLTQVFGPILFLTVHLLITIALFASFHPISDYFMKKTNLFSGIGSGILIFVCAWMIVHNIVYTL